MGVLQSLIVGLRRQGAEAPETPAVRPHPPGDVLLDSLHEVVFRTDGQGRWAYLNARWPALTGFTVEDSLGSELLQYVHPHDRERMAEHMQSVAGEASRPDPVTLRFLTHDERSLWLEVHANPLIDGNGDARGLCGTLTDVTERVHADELHLASHRNLASLLNNLPGMVYRGRNDMGWTMEYVSGGCYDLTGFPPEDLCNNRNLPFGSLIHHDDRQLVWNEVQAALREDRQFEIVYRIRTAKGEEKWVWERGQGIFSTSGELLGLEGFITDITSKKREELRFQQNALYDPVIGLPTRALFLDRLENALRRVEGNSDYGFACVVMYLDRFLRILNKFGPDLGDQIALEIGRRVQHVLGPSDTICRLRDEEFGIIIEHVHAVTEVNRVAQLIQDNLLSPIVIGDAEVYATASIGIALSSTGYKRVEEMLRDADAATNRAKELGGGRYEVFDLSINARAAAIAQLERELQKALEGNQLCLLYQPVVSLQSGRTHALEARLAWRHPRRGVLPAEEFFRIAEDTQLILPIKERMLTLVCEHLARWGGRLAFKRQVGIHLQVCGRTLLEPGFRPRLVAALLEAAGEHFRISLELPEEVVEQSARLPAYGLDQVRAQGLGLVLDGFGAGSSSLLNLRKGPLDAVKIDRSFMERGGHDSGFIAAVVSSAHALNMPVIADGLTERSQIAELRALGCDYAQGDVFSPPVDGEQADSLLTDFLR